jgi:hypothetical protein
MAARAGPTSTAFHAYTDEQWAAIEGTIPLGKIPPGRDIRFELEQIGREFWLMRGWRLRRLSSANYDRLCQCIELLAQISDPLFQTMITESLIDKKLVAWKDWAEIYRGRAFQRGSDEHRELLYDRVIRVWTRVLGGRVASSASGPSTRFLDVVLGPILGSEAPGPEGIKALVQRRGFVKRQRRPPHRRRKKIPPI